MIYSFINKPVSAYWNEIKARHSMAVSANEVSQRKERKQKEKIPKIKEQVVAESFIKVMIFTTVTIQKYKVVSSPRSGSRHLATSFLHWSQSS
jgi:hypothetical protein